jgi:uncharacterized membrane protein (DUF485 family)
MLDPTTAKLLADPKYQELVAVRNSYSWICTILMLIAYFGFILTLAFDKAIFAQKIGDGVTSLGVPVGLGVILFTIAITGIYVRKANTDFDALKDALVKDIQK